MSLQGASEEIADWTEVLKLASIWNIEHACDMRVLDLELFMEIEYSQRVHDRAWC